MAVTGVPAVLISQKQEERSNMLGAELTVSPTQCMSSWI